MKHNTICVQLQWFPSAPTMGTSNKHDTFHQCCFIVPASVEDHGTTFIHQRRKVSCFPGAMYEDGRTRGLLLGDSGYPSLLYLTPIARPTTDSERHYNRSHIMTWNIIERLFGVLKHFLRQMCMFALWPPHQIKHQIDYNNCGLLCFAQHSKKTQGNSYSLLSWMMTITLMVTSLILICCHPSTHETILWGQQIIGPTHFVSRPYIRYIHINNIKINTAQKNLRE